MTQRDAKDTIFSISRATSNNGRTLATHDVQPTFLFLYAVLRLVAQLCLTLCDPMDCSPPGSSVHGFLQARILEWVIMPCSRLSLYIQPQISCNSHFSLAIFGGAQPGSCQPKFSGQKTRQKNGNSSSWERKDWQPASIWKQIHESKCKDLILAIVFFPSNLNLERK